MLQNQTTIDRDNSDVDSPKSVSNGPFSEGEDCLDALEGSEKNDSATKNEARNSLNSSQSS
jgi:hypothetical protein